jgi:glycosyltransferase involved in cell wall biosynthesis
VNYNGARYLPDSLGCAVAQRDKFAEILSVDNASEDRSIVIGFSLSITMSACFSIALER